MALENPFIADDPVLISRESAVFTQVYYVYENAISELYVQIAELRSTGKKYSSKKGTKYGY